jgi:hypothetical protein
MTVLAIGGVERRQIHLRHGIEHKPRQVALRQLIPHIRRHQKRLPTVTLDEVLSHAGMVVTASDNAALRERTMIRVTSKGEGDMKKKPMDLAEQLSEQAGVRLHRRPRMDLIAVDDAHAFLDACAARGVRVLGIEGFYLRGDELHVDMSRIADFSSVTDASQSIDESRRFVDEVGVANLMLDFTLEPN